MDWEKKMEKLKKSREFWRKFALLLLLLAGILGAAAYFLMRRERVSVIGDSDGPTAIYLARKDKAKKEPEDPAAE